VKHTTGFYPRLRVDTSRVSAVGQAGGVLLTETIRASGLAGELSSALERWRKPTAIHDPAKIVLDLAVSLALGGDCLADITLLRAEPAVFGRVASDPTVSRTIDGLATDVDAALKAIDVARAAARATVWASAGEAAPDHGCDAQDPLILDVDATLVGSHSEKQHAKPRSNAGSGSTRCVCSSTTAPPGPGNHCRSCCGPVTPARTLPSITSMWSRRLCVSCLAISRGPGRVARC